MSESYRTVNAYVIADAADAELTFLQTAFGGTVDHLTRDDEGLLRHGEVLIGDSTVMLAAASPAYPATRSAFYLWIDDVDATFARAVAAGGRIESEPADKPYGHRQGGVIDPAGNTWWIAAPVTATPERDGR